MWAQYHFKEWRNPLSPFGIPGISPWLWYRFPVFPPGWLKFRQFGEVQILLEYLWLSARNLTLCTPTQSLGAHGQPASSVWTDLNGFDKTQMRGKN